MNERRRRIINFNQMKYEAEPFKFTKDIDGLTLKSLQEHYKLYEGYVKKANEIGEKLAAIDKSDANGVYSAVGELKRQETFALNGMKLHEIYFACLNADPLAGESEKEPRGETAELIIADFGSIDAWKADITAAAGAARGWAMLAFDLKDNRLRNYAADAHNIGAVWGAIPLLALDVYEHAYFMDYGANKKSYLEAFFKNLDWRHANKAVKHFDLAKKHGK